MKEIPVSKFKAKCTAVMDRVSKTKEPIRVTRHGKPIVDVVPPKVSIDPATIMGSMRDSIKILGDIVSPVIDLNDIEALRD